MDFTTLGYVQAGMLLISAVVFLTTRGIHAGTEGLTEWVYGSLLMMVSFILLALFVGPLPYSPVSVTAILLGWFGYYLFYRGLCLFRGSRPRNREAGIAGALLLGLLLYGDILSSEPKFWRVWVGSLGVAALSLLTAGHLAAIMRRYSGVDLLLVGSFSGAGLVWTLRTILTILAQPPPTDYTRPIDGASFYASIFLIASMTMGLVLMVLKRLQQQWMEAAVTDPLTGILNRRGFFLLAEPTVARAAREGAPLVVVAADLDRFKGINDRHGHGVGDVVLQSFVQVLREGTRTEDINARFGGEEFVTLFAGVDILEAGAIVERLRERFERLDLQIAGMSVRVTVSFGISSGMAAGDLERLIERADQALLLAKRRGRNRLEIWRDQATEAPSL